MKEYRARFHLYCPVNNYDKAKDYLKAENMTKYLRDYLSKIPELQYKIENIEWDLTDEQNGFIIVKTNAGLFENEASKISDWIKSQCADGLGEGFEQQDFAMIFDEDDPENSDYEMASFDWESNDYELEFIGEC